MVEKAKDKAALPEKKPEAVAKKTAPPEKKAVKPDAGKLFPVKALAGAAGVPAWELAGLMRAAGWADGKQVTPAAFGAAMAKFRNRPQGGGSI